MALANESVSIYDTRYVHTDGDVHAEHRSIIYTYEDSDAYTVQEMLQPEVIGEITMRAKALQVQKE